MKLNNNLVIIGAVVIVAILLFSGFGGLKMIGLQAIDTATKNNPNILFGTTNMDGYKGHQALLGQGEMTNRQSYISSWYGTGNSEVIHFTGKLKMWVYDFSGLPMNTIGKYGFKVFFNDLQIAGFDPVTGQGFYKNDYILPEDDYVSDSMEINGATWTAFDISKFPVSEYHDETWWDAREQNPLLDHSVINSGVSKEWVWTTVSDMPSGGWWTPTFLTQSVLFHMIGPKVGTIKVEFYVESQPIKHGSFDTWSGGTSWQLVQTDQFGIQSGRGSISVLPIGNDGTDGSKPATGQDGEPLGTTYTKYHFQEGDTVTIQYQTGFSGQTSKKTVDAGETPYTPDEGWQLQIYNPNNPTGGAVATFQIPDNDYGTKTYPIPVGAFKLGGVNEWKVILNNGIFDQDELLLFVVDSRANLPPTPTIKFNPEATPQVGKALQVIVESGINANTNSNIQYFTITAKYGQTGTDYVAGFSTTNKIPATATGSGTFTASKQLTPTKAGDIYVQAWATDMGGRAGYVRERIITPATPQNYAITFKVTDASNSNAVQGATVKINYDSEITDGEGRCSFALQGGIYNIFITKSGYYDAKIEQRTIAGSQTINVALYPLGGSQGGGETPDDGTDTGDGTGTETGDVAGSIDVQVYDDASWDTLTGAMVTIGDVSGMTDDNGVVTLLLTGGEKEYDITVDIAGYEPYASTVTVEEYMTGQVWAYLTSIGGTDTGETDTGDVSDWMVDDTDGDGTADGYDTDIDDDGIENDVDDDYDGDGFNDNTENTPDQKYNVTVTVTNGDATTIVRIGTASGYGSEVKLSVSADVYTLKVGRAGYKVYTQAITIPDLTEYEVTLELDTGNDGDTDNDGIRNDEDDDLDNDGIANDVDPDIDGDGIPNDEDVFDYIPNERVAWYQEINWSSPLILFLMVIVIIAIIGVFVVILRRKR